MSLAYANDLLLLIVIRGERKAGMRFYCIGLFSQIRFFWNEVLLELLLPLIFPLPNRGTFDIYVKCDGVGRCVGNYDNRGSFGELALMYNTPRAATITATSPGALWGLVSEALVNRNVLYM